MVVKRGSVLDPVAYPSGEMTNNLEPSIIRTSVIKASVIMCI